MYESFTYGDRLPAFQFVFFGIYYNVRNCLTNF